MESKQYSHKSYHEYPRQSDNDSQVLQLPINNMSNRKIGTPKIGSEARFFNGRKRLTDIGVPNELMNYSQNIKGQDTS